MMNSWCVQCGASERLRTLIEGESLVNDGSASVVFFLMQVLPSGPIKRCSPIKQCSCRPGSDMKLMAGWSMNHAHLPT